MAKAVEEDVRIAHHEAAHVVMSYLSGAGGPTKDGIDIHAPTSVDGATGQAGVCLVLVEGTETDEELEGALRDNLVILFAGIASDALILGESLDEAADSQPGDRERGRRLLAESPVMHAQGLDVEDGMKWALEIAEKALGKHWEQVQELAMACLANGGKLSKAEILDILDARGGPST